MTAHRSPIRDDRSVPGTAMKEEKAGRLIRPLLWDVRGMKGTRLREKGVGIQIARSSPLPAAAKKFRNDDLPENIGKRIT